MNSASLKSFGDELQQQRRALVNEIESNREALESSRETGREEFEERGQRERDSFVIERLDERAQCRLREIDTALARIEAGTFGRCENCDGTIPEEKLRLDPTFTLCPNCSERNNNGEFASERSKQNTETIPSRGELPPDLALLDDEELQEQLCELIRTDGRIDMQELVIQARNGVVYLEGALPSEPEHQMLLNVLTDIAGVQEIVDHLEVEPLAWQRSDRSKEQDAREITPGTYPDQEPYGGTEDINLTKEEAVDYEPPDTPPPPPRRG